MRHRISQTGQAFTDAPSAFEEMLSKSKYDVRVIDLNPNNIGQMKFGICVEDGTTMKEEIRDSYAELILCTGSTLCNGSIVDYLDLDKEVLFFGTTASGTMQLSIFYVILLLEILLDFLRKV